MLERKGPHSSGRPEFQSTESSRINSASSHASGGAKDCTPILAKWPTSTDCPVLGSIQNALTRRPAVSLSIWMETEGLLPNSSVLRGTALSDRKSTRLNSSHLGISYAVFCLKKK